MPMINEALGIIGKTIEDRLEDMENRLEKMKNRRIIETVQATVLLNFVKNT